MDSTRIEETVKQLFADYLKNNKLRNTPERNAILSAIYSIEGCFEIEELLAYLEKNMKFRVSRATVYNTISLLTNANLVIHHQFGSESKYERCYGYEKSYSICTKCNKVTEIKNLKIRDYLSSNIKKFHLIHYSLYVYGLCSKCMRNVKRRKQKCEKL